MGACCSTLRRGSGGGRQLPHVRSGASHAAAGVSVGTQPVTVDAVQLQVSGGAVRTWKCPGCGVTNDVCESTPLGGPCGACQWVSNPAGGFQSQQRSRASSRASGAHVAPAPAAHEPWVCAACNFDNGGDDLVCSQCWYLHMPGAWCCAMCTAVNADDARDVCAICDAPRPEDTQLPVPATATAPVLARRAPSLSVNTAGGLHGRDMVLPTPNRPVAPQQWVIDGARGGVDSPPRTPVLGDRRESAASYSAWPREHEGLAPSMVDLQAALEGARWAAIAVQTTLKELAAEREVLLRALQKRTQGDGSSRLLTGGVVMNGAGRAFGKPAYWARVCHDLRANNRRSSVLRAILAEFYAV